MEGQLLSMLHMEDCRAGHHPCSVHEASRALLTTQGTGPFR